MRKSTALLAGALAVVLGGAIAHGDPIPGFSKAQSPLTKVNTSTVGIQASSTGQAGYMSAAQASDLAFVLAGGLPTPTPFVQADPLTQAHWTSTTGEFTATGNGGILAASGSTSGTAWGDTFTRANGALVGALPGVPYLSGFGGGLYAAYTEGGSLAFSVTSNSARAAGNGSSVLYADSGVTSGTLSVTMAVLEPGSGPGLVFRTSSSFSQFILYEWFGGTFYLEHCTSAPITCAADATAVGTLASGDTLSVVYSGNTVTGKKNGTTVVSATITQYVTNTGAGILNYSDTSGNSHYTNLSLSGDSRKIVIEGETATTPWYLALGAFGRGSGSPGMYFGGPADSGKCEFQRAVSLDSSFAVTGASALAATSVTTLAASSTVTGTQLRSTVATGTAPATAASTTVVTNWNADLLDGFDSTAFELAGALRPTCRATLSLAWGTVTDADTVRFTGQTCTGAATGDGCTAAVDTALPNGASLFAQGDGAGTVVVLAKCNRNGAGNCTFAAQNTKVVCTR